MGKEGLQSWMFEQLSEEELQLYHEVCDEMEMCLATPKEQRTLEWKRAREEASASLTERAAAIYVRSKSGR